MEFHRFHQTSGAAVVAPAAAPDHQPRDLAPKQTTVLTKIRLARRIFLSRDQQIEASRTTPAVTLGVTDRVWTIGDLIDAALA